MDSYNKVSVGFGNRQESRADVEVECKKAKRKYPDVPEPKKEQGII